MLFKITKDGALFNPEAVKLCSEMKGLSADEQRFVILAMDYDGPYHQFTPEEAVRKAKREVYGTQEFDDTEPRIRAAMDAYLSCQYSFNRELIKRYKEKIVLVSSQLITETEPTKIQKFDLAIAALTKRCEQIQQEINQDEKLNIKGGGKLSVIEKWQSNRLIYKEQEKRLEEKTGTIYL